MGVEGGGLGVDVLEESDGVVEGALDVVEAELLTEAQGVPVSLEEKEQVAVQVYVREGGGGVPG